MTPAIGKKRGRGNVQYFHLKLPNPDKLEPKNKFITEARSDEGAKKSINFITKECFITGQYFSGGRYGRQLSYEAGENTSLTSVNSLSVL